MHCLFVRWMLYSLRWFLRFAYEDSFIERDLSALVPARRTFRKGHVPRALPAACITALATLAPQDNPAELRVSAIVCLLSTYGVRGVQLRRLRLGDVDWTNDRIVFPAAKGGEPIEQYLTAEAGNRLADYITFGRPVSACPALSCF